MQTIFVESNVFSVNCGQAFDKAILTYKNVFNWGGDIEKFSFHCIPLEFTHN